MSVYDPKSNDISFSNDTSFSASKFGVLVKKISVLENIIYNNDYNNSITIEDYKLLIHSTLDQATNNYIVNIPVPEGKSTGYYTDMVAMGRVSVIDSNISNATIGWALKNYGALINTDTITSWPSSGNYYFYNAYKLDGGILHYYKGKKIGTSLAGQFEIFEHSVQSVYNAGLISDLAQNPPVSFIMTRTNNSPTPTPTTPAYTTNCEVYLYGRNWVDVEN